MSIDVTESAMEQLIEEISEKEELRSKCPKNSGVTVILSGMSLSTFLVKHLRSCSSFLVSMNLFEEYLALLGAWEILIGDLRDFLSLNAGSSRSSADLERGRLTPLKI